MVVRKVNCKNFSGKHLFFMFLKDKPKTSVWEVRNKYEYTLLGCVKWFAKFRKYSFFPEKDTVFEKDCLRDIADFCEERTGEQRSKKLL